MCCVCVCVCACVSLNVLAISFISILPYSMPPVPSSTAITPGTTPSATVAAIPSADATGTTTPGANKPLFPSASTQVSILVFYYINRIILLYSHDTLGY